MTEVPSKDSKTAQDEAKQRAIKINSIAGHAIFENLKVLLPKIAPDLTAGGNGIFEMQETPKFNAGILAQDMTNLESSPDTKKLRQDLKRIVPDLAPDAYDEVQSAFEHMATAMKQNDGTVKTGREVMDKETQLLSVLNKRIPSKGI